VDGDGDQDVLITGQNSSSQRIAELYTNNGSEGYSLVSETPFDGVWLSSIAFADVDGDDDQDVMITGQNSSFQRIAKLYTNNGSEGYSLVNATPFDGVDSGSIAFADVDGDSDQDVLIIGRNSSLLISKLYRNTTPHPCPITVSCTPFTLTLSPSGSATLQPEDIDNGSTVTCGTPILILSQSEFDLSHIGENTVNLVVTDEFGNSDTCTVIVTVVEQTLAILESEFNALALGVWPNPANDESFVSFSAIYGSEATIQLFDITGKVMATLFHGNITPGAEQRVQINVANLANGLYMCRLFTEHGTIVKKLVVSR
jgi:hypothetical protein